MTVSFVLTLLGAALACSLELVEALAIVLAVALERGARNAVLGALGAVAALAPIGVLLGPVLASGVGLNPLRIVVGVLLLWFGGQWLRKGVLRLAGRRARSSAYGEWVAEREALAGPAGRGSDWAARALAFKGVLLEGVEIVVIVAALADRPGGALPALLGAALAALITAAIGLVLHRPLQRVPETELKYAVGVVLCSFGTFFFGEGAGIEWPLGDGALLALAFAWLLGSQMLVRGLRVTSEPA